MEYISYEDFKKIDIRVGEIKSVEPVPDTDKLLRCEVDFGKVEQTPEEESSESTSQPKLRQIVSGIREFFPDYETLIGKQVLYVVNLEPRTIKGVESHGMLMAVDGTDGAPVFLVPDQPVNPGAKTR